MFDLYNFYTLVVFFFIGYFLFSFLSLVLRENDFKSKKKKPPLHRINVEAVLAMLTIHCELYFSFRIKKKENYTCP